MFNPFVIRSLSYEEQLAKFVFFKTTVFLLTLSSLWTAIYGVDCMNGSSDWNETYWVPVIVVSMITAKVSNFDVWSLESE
uniref:Transmembrane protein n=1 Tax=Steinernema glaseri TaxID=37863 RepID=A0A1I8A663_9BILA